MTTKIKESINKSLFISPTNITKNAINLNKSKPKPIYLSNTVIQEINFFMKNTKLF
jgi:hypothetical protein